MLLQFLQVSALKVSSPESWFCFSGDFFKKIPFTLLKRAFKGSFSLYRFSPANPRRFLQLPLKVS